MSVLHGKNRFERSALPAVKQLDTHVKAGEFLLIAERCGSGTRFTRIDQGSTEQLVVERADLRKLNPGSRV